MSHFHWIRNPPKINAKGEEIATGGEMLQVDDSLDPKPVEVAQPAAVSVKEKAAKIKKHHCIACEPPTAFGTMGVLSMHFKKVHEDLWEDKDSFREYVTTIEE